MARILQEDIIYQGLVTFLVLPRENVDTFKKTQTTPSVRNVRVFITINTAATTITNFIGGADGQEIKILGDGFTTIANNANINTNTGANKLLVANKVYRFTYFQSKNLWAEDA